MNKKHVVRKVFGQFRFVVYLLLILSMLAMPVAPAFASAPANGNTLPASIYAVSSQQDKAVQFAQKVEKSLSFHNDGTVTANMNALADLPRDQVLFVRRFVNDVNSGKIGISVVKKDGSVALWGSDKALAGLNLPLSSASKQFLQASESPDAWANWYGVHVYVNHWWTEKIESGAWEAIGLIVGGIVAALVASGFGAVAGIGAGFVYGMLWWVEGEVLKPYWPDAFTLHFPWWGHVHVQLWKSGAWYNGRWFWTPYRS